MTAQTEELRKQKISKVKESLQRARALRESRQAFGVNGICQFVDKVDGDWLEKWSEDDTPQSVRNNKKVLCVK